MSEDTPCGIGNYVNLFQKCQIIGIRQAKKTSTEETSSEIYETTKIRLRTVQCIIKNWKNGGEPSPPRKKCGQKKVLNDRDWRSLKCFVKLSRKNT